MAPLTLIETPRLLLRASDPAFAGAAADFYTRNRGHFARWSPPLGEESFTEAGQQAALTRTAQAVDDGTTIGWWLFARGAPERAIGQLHFTQIARRAFQSAMLGYSIDAAREGQGLMSEALRAGIADAFGPRVWLHRIQANVRPENTRSLVLLDRLGFQREGCAPAYLFIDGAWRDHVMTALLNPAWALDDAPK